jgi:lipopolysaccharide O-acetyltransferase
MIQFGRDVRISDSVHIGAIESVLIGDRVLIASNVFISDHNHGAYGKGAIHSGPDVAPFARAKYSLPIIIEDDVWLGEFVSVLPGVRIGRGSIIGTMTTVTHDIPPYSIAVGSPARVIKKYNAESAQWETV